MRGTLLSSRFAFPIGEYFPSCHASTVVRRDDGRLVVACFGGTRESADDVRIHVAVEDGEGVFRRTAVVTAAEDTPHWNPVLYRRRDGTILLWFKAGGKIAEWETWRCESFDGGHTFTKPRCIDTAASPSSGPVKNKPLLLADGTLVAPRSRETAERWTVQMQFSTDEGESWNETEPLTIADTPYLASHRGQRPEGVIQPTLWEDDRGVHALMRSTFGRILRADSRDCGRSWSPAYDIDLPNNNSGIDLAAIGGKVALVCNPVGSNWGPRTPLDVMIGDGARFEKLLSLETARGEFSYPAVIADGNVLTVCYTWYRRSVAVVEIELTD